MIVEDMMAAHAVSHIRRDLYMDSAAPNFITIPYISSGGLLILVMQFPITVVLFSAIITFLYTRVII